MRSVYFPCLAYAITSTQTRLVRVGEDCFEGVSPSSDETVKGMLEKACKALIAAKSEQLGRLQVGAPETRAFSCDSDVYMTDVIRSNMIPAPSVGIQVLLALLTCWCFSLWCSLAHGTGCARVSSL